MASFAFDWKLPVRTSPLFGLPSSDPVSLMPWNWSSSLTPECWSIFINHAKCPFGTGRIFKASMLATVSWRNWHCHRKDEIIALHHKALLSYDHVQVCQNMTESRKLSTPHFFLQHDLPFDICILWCCTKVVHVWKHGSILARSLFPWFDHHFQGPTDMRKPPCFTYLIGAQNNHAKLTSHSLQLTRALGTVVIGLLY